MHISSDVGSQSRAALTTSILVGDRKQTSPNPTCSGVPNFMSLDSISSLSNNRSRVAESRMKSMRNNIVSRSLFSLFRKQPFPAPPPGPLLPHEEPVDEEFCPGYNSTHCYPVKPGDVLANRYQALVKVGWGGSSTVWFARDLRG
jgi:hypothetical protein